MTPVEWDGQPVKKPCSNCDSLTWYEMRTVFEDLKPYDWCNDCPDPVKVGSIPDVYLKHIGQTFENLTDAMGKPIPIQSKQHKKEVMEKLGVREAGDRINGAPFGTKTWVDGTREWRKKQFEKERPMIRETYKRYLDNMKRRP